MRQLFSVKYGSFLRKVTMKELVISLKIEKEKPLNLQDFSAAILALNASLSRFVEQERGINEFALELKSVEKGSNIFNFLVSVYSIFLINEYISAINSYFDLWKNLKTIKNQNVEQIQKEKYIDKMMVKDMLNIIKLYENGANAKIINNFNDSQIVINQNTYKLYGENLDCLCKLKGFEEKREVKSIFENMLIEFYQTTNSQKPLKHKAFCFNLSKSAKDIFIDDERLKQEMLENPYNYRFLVDLEVYKDERGKITTYRAYHYKDKILKG